MSLRKAIEVVAKLAESGAIHRYAIAGAFAAMNYIAPTLSDDLDILISIEDFENRQSGLILLAPVEKALAEPGYSDRTDLGIMIEGWPCNPCRRHHWIKMRWTTPSISKLARPERHR